MEDITEFECNGCGIKFSPEQGGMCFLCNKLFCNLCLNAFKDEEGTKYFCIECKKPNKKTHTLFTKWSTQTLFFLRKLRNLNSLSKKL
ncbi:MAG: hypothetical protein AB1630_10495 [bacterium]